MKNKRFLNLGIILIFFIFNILITTTALFIVKCPITIWNIIFSTITTLIFYFIILKKQNETHKSILIQLSIFILIIIMGVFISNNIYDTSCDGNAYHKSAIGLLKNGWNPVYESIDEYNTTKENELELNNAFGLWNDHYAKAYWIYSSNFYTITNNIESGKSLYIITIIATFLICYSYLNLKIKKGLSTIISILLALNPVLLYQFSTYYNDALLGNFIIILIASLSMMITKENKEFKKLNYFLYFMTLCILINIKFTGFAYAGIYSLFYFIYIIIKKEQRKENLKNIIIAGFLAVIISVFLIGLSTYPTNFKDHNHPFYPLYGEDKVDIMTNTTPTGLHNMNRIKRFLIANTSKTYNVGNGGEVLYKIKIPFTFNVSELNEFRYSDVRIGGYGVLFSGILITSLILGLYALYKFIKEKRDYIPYLIPILATLFIIIIMKESWWARYLPQLYAMPMIAIIMLTEIKHNKITKYSIPFLLIMLFINSYLIISPQLEEINYQRNIIKNEEELIKLIPEDEEILIATPEFDGAIFNIYDNHKNLKIIKPEEAPEKGYIKYRVMGTSLRINIYIKEETYKKINKK
jgi:hypothetical protein